MSPLQDLRQPGNIRKPRRQRGIGGEVVMRFPGFRKDIHADFDAGGGGIFVKILVANPFPFPHFPAPSNEGTPLETQCECSLPCSHHT